MGWNTHLTKYQLKMFDNEKYSEARKLLDKLYDKIDEGGLNNWEQSMFDVLAWLLDGTDKPELD